MDINENTGRVNNSQTITTPAGRFLVEQRNAGFADNDGRWIVSQLPELYWSPAGCMRRRRPGAFLGAFLGTVAVEAVIEGAALPPVQDEMVL